MSIQSKKQFYARDEANELLESESKRRKDCSETRSEAARRLIQQKQHKVILNEISQNKSPSVIEGSHIDVKSLEEDYRNSVLGFQQQIQQEIEQLQYELYTQFNTIDTHRKIGGSQNADDQEIIEEVAQLNEKPHPLPIRPQSHIQYSQQTNQFDLVDTHKKENAIKQEQKKPNSSMSFKSPDKPFIGQNINHQMNFHKNMVSPKVFYRNNFNKDSKFVEKQHSQLKKKLAQQNLNNQLSELVESYDKTSGDPDKVEDMILELNRVGQKNKGVIPQQNQTKIYKYANEAELQRNTYKALRKSRSPAIKNSVGDDNNSSKQIATGPFGQKKSACINVNQDRLRDIINSAESKVKQNIQSKRSNATTNLSSSRISVEKINIAQSQCQTPQYQTYSSNNHTPAAIDDVKQQLSSAVNDINARVLAKFLKRKASAPGDYELAYLLTLLAAVLDDKIPMTGDKNDLLQKQWDEMCKQLSNHGKIVYALQKIRIVYDKDEFNKALSKVQYIKKFEEFKQTISKCEGDSQPIYQFIQRVVSSLQQHRQMLFKQNKPQHKHTQSSATKNTIPKYKKEFYLAENNYQNTVESPQTQRVTQISKSSPQNTSRLMRTPKSNSIEAQLLKQKQMAIEKTYQLQLDQSRTIQKQESSAKKKQLEIAKMKMLNKALCFRINKEDKLRLQTQQKNEEIEHIKYTSDFRHRMNSVDLSQVEQEKRRKRESSLENQEFKRNVRKVQQDQQITYYKEESQKSKQEYEWKQKQEQKATEKKNLQIKQKYEQALLSKVRLNENYLTFKESDLDDRIKSQFESASHRFKQLQKQEDQLRNEMSMLQSISARQSKKK